MLQAEASMTTDSLKRAMLSDMSQSPETISLIGSESGTLVTHRTALRARPATQTAKVELYAAGGRAVPPLRTASQARTSS